MKRAVLALAILAVIALAAGGSHGGSKGGGEVRVKDGVKDYSSKRSDLKDEGRTKEQKKCSGKKSRGEKNVAAETTVREAEEVVRGKRASPAEREPKKGMQRDEEYTEALIKDMEKKIRDKARVKKSSAKQKGTGGDVVLEKKVNKGGKKAKRSAEDNIYNGGSEEVMKSQKKTKGSKIAKEEPGKKDKKAKKVNEAKLVVVEEEELEEVVQNEENLPEEPDSGPRGLDEEMGECDRDGGCPLEDEE